MEFQALSLPPTTSLEVLPRIAITGLGVLCPIGCEPQLVLAALCQGRGGIGPITRFATKGLASQLAGETDVEAVRRWLTEEELRHLDWTAQLAVAAGRQAWRNSGISPQAYSSKRIGLCVGASGAGLNYSSATDLFGLRFQPQEQATAIAAALGIGGPVVMFTSASAGSGLALAHAMSLLRNGHCDAVLAGGAEALSEVNQASMDTMRLCSAGPCSPFSGDSGLTPGEGSAFFLLERLDDALARGAQCRAELYSFGASQDAYDMVGGDPSGDGLARAFTAALRMAALPSSAIDWIKANGTSNREQDASETLAIKHVFDPSPAVFAPESFVGHANGAAPAITLGLALIAFNNELLPPTINFSSPRAGCDLDYVPNQPRRSAASRVLASSIGFGGSNVALIFGKPRQAPLSPKPPSGLCITGVGIVSPFGVGSEFFIQALRERKSALRNAPRLQTCDCPVWAGLVEQPLDRRFSNKLTLLQRYALAASAEALAQADIKPEDFEPNRMGVYTGLTRGSAAARSQFAAALSDKAQRRTIGRYVLRMGRFTVSSVISQQFKLKGYGATISEGFGAGLHGLAHACSHMRSSSAEDAMLVVAADEIGPGTLASLAECNWLARGHDGCYLRPYEASSSGTFLSEGAVALVVERTSVAEKRGARIQAHIKSVGFRTGKDGLGEAIEEAKADMKVSAAYGNGSGIWLQDGPELRALRSNLRPLTPVSTVNLNLGFAESTSGLFQVAAALHTLQTGEFFPLAGPPQSGSFPRQLITATTERNRHAAVVLEA